MNLISYTVLIVIGILQILSQTLISLKNKIFTDVAIPVEFIPKHFHNLQNLSLGGKINDSFIFFKLDVQKGYSLKFYDKDGVEYKFREETNFYQTLNKVYSSDEKIKINFHQDNLIFQFDFDNFFLNFVLIENDIKVIKNNDDKFTLLSIQNNINKDAVLVKEGQINKIEKSDLVLIRNGNEGVYFFKDIDFDTIIYGYNKNKIYWSYPKIDHKLSSVDEIVYTIKDQNFFHDLSSIDENLSISNNCYLLIT